MQYIRNPSGFSAFAACVSNAIRNSSGIGGACFAAGFGILAPLITAGCSSGISTPSASEKTTSAYRPIGGAAGGSPISKFKATRNRNSSAEAGEGAGAQNRSNQERTGGRSSSF